MHAHPVITDTVDRLAVFEGQSVTLPCDVTGTPVPTVTWRKGATVVTSESEQKSILNDNSLLIFSAEVNLCYILALKLQC